MSHTFATASRQMNLLEVQPVFHIPSNAHARNAYGTAAQEIACAALQLLPIPIDGSKSICFDASDGTYPYEIKSVHRNGKVVIYDWRMETDIRCITHLQMEGLRRGSSALLRFTTLHSKSRSVCYWQTRQILAAATTERGIKTDTGM